jgi:hypothetical protein
VAAISVADVPVERANDATGALVLSISSGAVKAKLAERSISITDSLVVHKPTVEAAKASLEELKDDREKQLAAAREAQGKRKGLVNAHAEAQVRKVKELEHEVADLDSRLEALEGVTDAPPPSVETSPEPKTPPTASPPAEGMKVVEEVDLTKTDAGQRAELESELSAHLAPVVMIAIACIGVAICIFLGGFRLMHQ